VRPGSRASVWTAVALAPLFLRRRWIFWSFHHSPFSTASKRDPNTARSIQSRTSSTRHFQTAGCAAGGFEVPVATQRLAARTGASSGRQRRLFRHRQHAAQTNLFDTPEKRDLLECHLLTLAKQFNWQLEAWAVFANHYHIVARGQSQFRESRRIPSRSTWRHFARVEQAG